MSKALYKTKCIRCRKNMAVVYSRRAKPICTECVDKELKEEIKDKKMKAFFDIPRDLYYEYEILRSIRSYYVKFGKITERQGEAFKSVVDKATGKSEKKEKKSDQS